MKKIGIFVLSLSMLAMTSIKGTSSLNESTIDVQNGSGIAFKKNALIGNSEATDISKIYVQHGVIDGYDSLRFVTAIKGDISSVRYVRTALDGSSEKIKEVTTLYKAVVANGNNTYYDGKNLTTDESYAGNYYWACYTIKFVNDIYKSSDINITIKVDDISKSTTANLNKIIEDEAEVEPTPEEPDLNEKYGTPRRTYLNKANGNEFNIDNYGYIYQAEEASLSEGVNISKENLNAMNNHHIQNVNVGRSFTFEINAREETEALLMLGMVVNGDNGVKIKLDDIFEITYGTSSDNLDKKVFTNSRELEKSNTWDSFRDTVVGEIKLSKGKNIIKVSTTKFAANYDYMSLVSPLDKGEKAPLEKESDIVKTYGEVNLAKKEELEKGDETSFNLTKKGFVYEAEKGEIFNARIANNSIVDNFKAGGSVTFTIKSSIDTKALMTINTSMWHIWDAPIYEMMTVTYGTNKNELVNTANSYDHFMPAQGDWNNYQNHIVGEINLKKGINYIKVKELTSFNIDYISLFNQLDKIDPSAPVDPVPDPEPKPDPEIKGDWKDVYGVCVQKDLKDGSESKKFDDANRGYYFEAESAKLFGDSKLEDKPNASGGKFVNRIRTSNGKASGLIFEIESSKDRKTLLKTAFAQAKRDRHAFKDLLKVEVGQSEEALKEVSIDPNYIFEGTNGWTDFKEDVVGEISLTKGKNIIKITGLQSDDKAFNCDYISLLNPYKDESTDSEYIKNTYGTWKYEDLASTDESFNLIKEKRGTIFEAEKAERSETLKVETGKQGVSCESNISGFGKDEYLTFTVNAKEDTKCLLVIAASGADDRFIPVSSLFNVTYGTSKETLDSKVNSYERYYQYSNDWMKYNNAMVGEVSLKAGVNIIKVIGSVPSDIYQMNIDYMALINAL